MTIKEVEARTGLARANIRYYEDEGFFTPERGENGYRNYTGRDVDLLLKVKLLRQLGFSLEDIHDLQRGDRDLGSALELREAGLEKGQRELDRAAALCRELREDGAEFATLNAQLYLDRLAQDAGVLREDRTPKRVFPWRRWFARGVDQGIWSTLLALCGLFSFEIAILGKDGNTKGGVVLSLLALLLTAASETFFLHRFGTTPGKALFGLRIVREDGTPLSLGEAARRSFTVAGFLAVLQLPGLLPESMEAMRTLGFGVNTLGYGWLYWNVTHELPVPWEREGQVYLDGSTKETSFWDRKGSWTRVAGYILVVLLCSGITGWAEYRAAQPPHREAELTVEEFVDNYNFYDRYEKGKMSLPRLAENGSYQYRPGKQYGWHFAWDEVDPPQFRFAQQDGAVTGVTIYREYESDTPLEVHHWQTEILPGGQLRVSLRALGVDKDEADRAAQAVIDAEGNLHQDFDGFRVDCETEFSGYRLYFHDGIEENVLSGIEGETQRYFVEFSVSVT